MRTRLHVGALLGLISVLLCRAHAAEAQRRTWLIVGSDWPETGAAWMLERFGVLDSVAAAVNRRLRLQTTVTLLRDTSSAVNSYYERRNGEPTIRVTDGLVDEAARWAIPRSANTIRALSSPNLRVYSDQGYNINTPGAQLVRLEIVATSVVGYAVLHEVGHGLVDLLRLPVLGRGEDAADQFATWFILTDTTAAVRYDLFGVVSWMWHLSELAGSDTGLITLEEEGGAHGTLRQRGYLVDCLVYGHDPMSLPEDVPLPVPGRTLDECRREWLTVKTSWERLLRPYVYR